MRYEGKAVASTNVLLCQKKGVTCQELEDYSKTQVCSLNIKLPTSPFRALVDKKTTGVAPHLLESAINA